MIYVVRSSEEVVHNSIAFSASLLVMDSFSVSSLKEDNYLQRQNYLHINSEVIGSSIYMLKRTSLTQAGSKNSSFPFLPYNSKTKTTVIFTYNIISDKTSLGTPNHVMHCRKSFLIVQLIYIKWTPSYKEVFCNITGNKYSVY